MKLFPKWTDKGLESAVNDAEVRRLSAKLWKSYLLHGLGTGLLGIVIASSYYFTKDSQNNLKHLPPITAGIAAIIFNKKLYDKRTRQAREEFRKYIVEKGYASE